MVGWRIENGDEEMAIALAAFAFNAVLTAWNSYMYFSKNSRNHGVFCALNSVACMLLLFAMAVSQ